MPIHEVHGFPVSTPNLNITRSKITLDSGATYIDLVDAIATAEESGALTLHTANTSNPHSTTAAQVGAYTIAAADAAIAAAIAAAAEVDAYVVTGIDNTGATNVTVALQALIDAHKGETVIVPDGTYLVGTSGAALLLDGATYNGTNIIFRPGAKLKLDVRASSVTNNYQACFAGLVLKEVDNVFIDNLQVDGNRSNQPAEEHIHCLVIGGSTNITLRNPRFRECRGDGIYICQSNMTSSSTQPQHITIVNVDGRNTAADGRNVVSIVAGENITINGMVGYGFGGTINSVVMPGGLDIEPDNDYQLCRHITATNIRLISYGTTPIAVQGRASDKGVTRDIVITGFDVYQLSAATIADDMAATTQTNNQGFQISRSTNVVLTNGTVRFLNAWGIGGIVTASDDVIVDAVAAHRVHVASRVGADGVDATTNGVWNSYINVHGYDVCRYGVSTGKITNTTLDGRIETPTTGMYTDLYAVIANTYTQTDCTYSVSVAASASWTRSYRLNGATFANTSIKDCAIGRADGSTWASDTARFGDTGMLFNNVIGITEVTAIPTGGTFGIGQFIRNVGTTTDVLGWLRLTASNGTSQSTDWRIVGIDNYTVLSTDFTGSNVDTAQPVFAAAQDTITLAASTTYEFEAFYWWTRAAGTTSHTSAVLYGGTATFTSFTYQAEAANPTGATLATPQVIPAADVTAVVVTAANTSATENVVVRKRGIMRVNTAGTLIPQFKFSAAPGGAPTVKSGSFFRCKPIGGANFVTSGAWA